MPECCRAGDVAVPGGRDKRQLGVPVRSRLILVFLLVVLASTIAASFARADNQMLAGFMDDPSFRWRTDSAQMLASAAGADG